MPTDQRPTGSAGPQQPTRAARLATTLAVSLAAAVAALAAGTGSAGAMGLRGSGGWNGPPHDAVYHGQPQGSRIGTRTGQDGTGARRIRRIGSRIVVVPPRENPPRPPGRPPHRPHRPIVVEFPSPAAPVGVVDLPPAPVAAPAASRGGGGAPAVVAPATGERRFVPDEVLVSFASTVSPQAIVSFAQGQRLALLGVHRLPLIDTALYRFRITDRRAVPAVLGSLRGDARIGAAQPNYLYTLQQAAAESLAGDPAQYVVAKLHLAQAHALTTGSHVLVAVIDSAIDDSHPELQGVLAGRFDAIKGRVSPHAHGTAMASAIAAHGRLIGVAPAAHLLAVRAFDGAGAGAQATTTRVLDGLQWAADSGARVVNMSFTGPADAKLHEMIAANRRKGLVLVAAAGNDGPQAAPDYPAAYPEVIAVTATDADDRLLKVANHGAYVSVAAPGVDIFVAAPEGRYGFTTGTSVATAHVSGLAALLIDRNPDLTPEAVQGILTRTAKHLASGMQDGQGSQAENAENAGDGAGLVDAYEALLALAPTTADSALGH